MASWQWDNVFDTGSWQVAVMYKGATTGATSYNAFVRRDLLNPAVLSCAIVDGEVVVTTVDDPDDGTAQEQPAILLIPPDSRAVWLRSTVLENDEVLDAWDSADLQLVEVTETSPGVFEIDTASSWVKPFADANEMLSESYWADRTSATYRAVLIQRGKPVPPPPVLAVAANSSPFIYVYPFDSVGGLSAPYANPGTLPQSGASRRRVKFSKDKDAIICNGGTTSSSVEGYGWSMSGFGSRYSNPSGGIFSSGPLGLDLNPINNDVVYTGGSSPYVYARPFDPSTGFGALYSSPATLPYNGFGFPVTADFHPAGNAVTFAVEATSGIRQYTYPWTPGTGFGTLYAAAAIPPNGTCRASVFSDAGDRIAAGWDASPFAGIWPWTAGTGFGARWTNPSGLSTVQSMHWHPSGTALAIGLSTFPVLHIRRITSTAWGTAYSYPGTAVGGSLGWSVSFNRAGNAVAIGYQTASPYFDVYAFDLTSGIGTKYAAPATIPETQVHGFDFW